MGERKDLIKFGPEWLRNLSSERNDTSNATSRPTSSAATNSRQTRTIAAASTSSSVSQTSGTSLTTTYTSAGQATGGGGVAAGTSASANQASSKVQLAKLRYGREEMLALFDTTSARAPAELKHNDVLYLARCKAPFALQETFEDTDAVTRENPKPSGIGTTDFSRSRGGSRPLVGSNDRQTNNRATRLTNRHGPARGIGAIMDQRPNSWNAMNLRMGLPPVASEETSSSQRPWHNSASGNRLPNEHSEWHNKVFKNKRPGNNSTNWRQGHRDEGGDEWRSSDLGRSRSNNNLVDRDWGDRHRRTWGSGEPHDELPEWFDNPDAGAGTFDATGAFHGVSNDDTSLPKSQETAHPLTRSHTHGSFERFERSRNFEENAEDWWASEKAQKLSPKKFETGEKFRQQSAAMPDVNMGLRRAESHGNLDEIPMKLENRPGSSASNANAMFKPQFERKAFNPLGRTDLEKASGQTGNFQSVMITSNTNNSLRQKHQNLVPPSEQQKSEDTAVDEMLHFPLERHMPTVTTMVTCTVTSTVAGITNARGQNSFADLMQMSTRTPFVTPQSIGLNMGINRVMKSDSANVPVMPNPGAIARGMPPIGMANPDMNNIATGDTLGGSGTMGSSALAKAALGSAAMGSASMGSAAMGSAAMGSAAMGSASMGSAAMGSAAMGSGAMGSAAIGNAAMGCSAMGSAAIGNAVMGSAAMGSAMPLGSNLLGGMTGAVLGNTLTKTGLGSALQSNPTINNVDLSNLIPMRGPNYDTIQRLRAMEMQNQGNQTNMYQMPGLQNPSTSNAYNALYGNLMHNVASSSSTLDPSEQEWYYEDPEKNIQGPFSTAEMYYWYSAGFFNNTMLVRRSCDTEMRPLGTYGPMPFNVMSTYSVPSGYDETSPNSRYTFLNNPNRISSHMMPNMPVNSVDSMQYGQLDMTRNPSFGQQPMDSLWGQPNSVLGWRQQNVQPAVNNPPIFGNGKTHVYWNQRSGIRLPEEIAKEMKTEDEILAQLRANQVNTKQNSPYPSGQSVESAAANNTNTANISLSPSLGDLHKIIKLDSPPPNPSTTAFDSSKILPVNESPQITEQSVAGDNNPKEQAVVSKPSEVNKQVDRSTSKSKENNNATKSKSKKSKEEKKEEPVPEAKVKEDENSQDERQVEVPLTPKAVQKEKSSKKEIEKESKIWAKDTYAIVKGADKSSNKDLKKKAEEVKVAEEAERKRKEEERLAAEEEKKRKQAELLRKQQESQQRELLQRASESVAKKAPWSFATQAMQATSNYGPTLAEIQRLEREKKLEQMKEQQHMMQIIAQHQAAALAREQEMQANLGWAKKKAANVNANPVSLAEIQAETRRKAASESSAALTQPQEEIQQPAPITTNAAPWGNNSNGDGFWDSPAVALKSDKKSDKRAVEPNKNKKKNNTVAKKEPSASAEFDLWCNTSLSTWSSSIDVPTFVNFLKDIESPYEVKDYVKCYLGETKDANDFARHFLERRSKLLRVGMATPSDDLCSPAAAINPRPTSTSDYQEVKVKGKRGKKNKMLKVDARILGFSVTAAEDRINVGDIDMA